MASTASASTSDGRDVLRWSDAATGKMSDLPHARGGAAVAHWELASQELLYMYGGCSVVQCYDQLLRLDLHRGKWAVEQVRGTPPKKRKGATLNLLGRSLDEQVLLVVGGWSADGPVPNGIKQYSIAHNTWEHRAFQGTPPPDRWAHTATSIDPEHVIVFGGEGTTPGQYLNDVYLFSLAEGEWRHLHPSGDERGGSERLLPTGRMGHTATLIQTPTSHALYIFGGYTTATRGMRQHRVATNDLWALDLRGGLATQRRDSPSSDYLKWVRVDTIGKPPAARGHHAAVSSAQGGNLFVAFGCDATEMVCYDDAYMLDTTYPQGHYWQQLPVGMLRPAPRQMLTAWVHEASLIVSGGCTPAQDSANDHCYSDVWELPLEGLMQGGKQLNATVHVVEEEAGLVAQRQDLRRRGRHVRVRREGGRRPRVRQGLGALGKAHLWRRHLGHHGGGPLARRSAERCLRAGLRRGHGRRLRRPAALGAHLLYRGRGRPPPLPPLVLRARRQLERQEEEGPRGHQPRLPDGDVAQGRVEAWAQDLWGRMGHHQRMLTVNNLC